jgi:hypothetical protein
MKVDKIKEMIELMRRLSKSGDVTIIGHRNEGLTIKKRDIDAFANGVDALLEREKEAVCG